MLNWHTKPSISNPRQKINIKKLEDSQFTTSKGCLRLLIFFIYLLIAFHIANKLFLISNSSLTFLDRNKPRSFKISNPKTELTYIYLFSKGVQSFL